MPFSPEPLDQNQNNFTEMVLMLPSTNIDKKLRLCSTTWLPKLRIEISLNQISLDMGQYIIYSCARTQVSNSGPKDPLVSNLTFSKIILGTLSVSNSLI